MIFEALKQSSVLVHEFFNSVFGLKDIKISIAGVIFSFTFGTILPFLERNVYYDETLFMFLVVVWTMDLISAILRSYHRGGSFSTYKALSAAAKFMAWVFIIFMANFVYRFRKVIQKLDNVDNPNEMIEKILLYTDLTPGVIIVYIIFIFTLSTLKNFQLINAFRSFKTFDVFLYKYVDTYKNRPIDRLWDLLSDKQKSEIIEEKNKS